MNIISFNNSIYAKPITNDKNVKTSYPSYPIFGLKLAKPLTQDTISFSGEKPTKKQAGSKTDGISTDLAMRIRKQVQEPHNSLKHMFENEFKEFLSTDEEKKSLTMLNRVKTTNSICEKSQSRGWTTQKQVLAHMGDISGFCFVLEDKKAESIFINKFSELIKTGKVNVEEIEYHRREPVYKKNQVVQSYDAMNIENIQKLKKAVVNAKNPTTQFYREVDSMSGYSGLHITIKTPSGIKSEIQVVPRSVYNAKVPENLLYKIRNGKDTPERYRYIEPFLEPLKVKDRDNMTPHEKMMQKAMSVYTREVYADALKTPYKDSHTFLSVEDSRELTQKEKNLIKDYDMNKIYTLMSACDTIDKKM